MDGSNRRPHRPGARIPVGALPSIDVEAMLRAGELVPGHTREGWVAWKPPHAPAIRIRYRGDMSDGAVALLGLENPLTGEPEAIELTVTRPHLGGRRWWFVCPRLGIRVRKLYLEGSGWASRKALGLGYASRREDRGADCFEALARIQRKLGGALYPGAPLPPRPRGMWRSSYSRLAARYRRLDAQCRHIMNALERPAARASRRPVSEGGP